MHRTEHLPGRGDCLLEQQHTSVCVTDVHKSGPEILHAGDGRRVLWQRGVQRLQHLLLNGSGCSYLAHPDVQHSENALE